MVTGSSKGIGFAIARSFYLANASVLINGRSQSSVDDAISRLEAEKKAALEESGASGSPPSPSSSSSSSSSSSVLHPFPCDLSSGEEVEAALAGLEEKGLVPDVLINNTGMFFVCEFGTVDDEKWNETFEVNVMSGVRLARAFLPRMLEKNSGGNIVFISSECGLRPIPEMIPYSVSKAAQISLARGLAELTKGTSVRVNSVLPGPTLTEGVETFLDQLKDKAIQEGGDPDEIPRQSVAANYFKVNEPTSLLGRFLDVQEVADVVLFIASDAAAGINGAAQKVEGGIVRSI